MPAFTTIATAAGLAGSAVSTGMSFSQASKQRQLQKKAEAEAAIALADAKKELNTNYSAALGIQKEPYNLEREALISAGAQAIEAGRESERGAAETAGRVYALQQQGQQQIASEMGKELTALDKATAEEAAKLRNARAQLNLDVAEGAGVAASRAANLAESATMQGVQGISNTLQQAASFVPLYSKSQSARAYGQAGPSFQESLTKPGIVESVSKTYGIDLSKAPTDPIKFQDFITTNFTKDQIKSLSQLAANGLPQAFSTGVTNFGMPNTQPLFDMGAYGVGGLKY